MPVRPAIAAAQASRVRWLLVASAYDPHVPDAAASSAAGPAAGRAPETAVAAHGPWWKIRIVWYALAGLIALAAASYWVYQANTGYSFSGKVVSFTMIDRHSLIAIVNVTNTGTKSAPVRCSLLGRVGGNTIGGGRATTASSLAPGRSEQFPVPITVQGNAAATVTAVVIDRCARVY